MTGILPSFSGSFLCNMMISGAKGQKAVHACMIRLLNLGPAEHEKVAIYAVNQRISNVRELREQLRCEAIRGYQVRGKIPFDPNILMSYNIAPEYGKSY